MLVKYGRESFGYICIFIVKKQKKKQLVYKWFSYTTIFLFKCFQNGVLYLLWVKKKDHL